MKEWIGESEKEEHQMSDNLRLSDGQKHQLVSLSCFSVDYKGIGPFKEMFFFFDRLNLLDHQRAILPFHFHNLGDL